MEYLAIEHEGKTIRGFLHGHDQKDVVLLFHGFTGNKVDHHFMIKTFAQDIASAGFLSYRFDFLGTGDSDGSFFEEESIYARMQQAETLIHTFEKRGYRVHLFAFSMGGVVATHLLRKHKIHSLFLLSPAGNFDAILKQMLQMGRMLDDGAEFNGFHISDAFIKEVEQFPYFEGISGYQGPVKLVQGTNDQYVSKASFDAYADVFDNCDAVWIQDADHCFSNLTATACVRKEIRYFYGKIQNMAI